jgi:hypothetical protein
MHMFAKGRDVATLLVCVPAKPAEQPRVVER